MYKNQFCRVNAVMSFIQALSWYLLSAENAQLFEKCQKTEKCELEVSWKNGKLNDGQGCFCKKNQITTWECFLELSPCQMQNTKTNT